MPSRAVLRKKARRESKRNKLIISSALLTQEKKLKKETPAPPQEEVKEKEKEEVKVKTPIIKIVNRKVENAKVVAAKRPREDVIKENVESSSLISTEGMSRKERKRYEAKRRFEKQLQRVNMSVARVTSTTDNNNNSITSNTNDDEENNNDNENKENNNNNNNNNIVSSTPMEKLRHDPKFINGTFWRTRKERRQRTVFLGNMPTKFSIQNVIDFVTSAVDTSLMNENEKQNNNNNNNNKEIEEEINKQENIKGEVVESVDFIPSMPRARQRHMFVTLQTKEAATHVVKILNGYNLEGEILRCNFAADKTQRMEAIERRSKNHSMRSY